MKGSASVVIIILIEVRRLPPGVFCAKMAQIVLLAVPLTGNGSLLEAGYHYNSFSGSGQIDLP